jgi:hypothetical protein
MGAEARRPVTVTPPGIIFTTPPPGRSMRCLKRSTRPTERRDPSLLPSVQNEPVVDPYRADPRFQALLQRMNLAPVQ